MNRALAITCSALLAVFLTQFTTSAQADDQSRYFDSNGIKIRYIEMGAGEPVILLHGFTRSVEDWLTSGIASNLSQTYRVIAFDARGHGLSGKPHSVSGYGKEMGRDIVRLMDHLDISMAHIVGYSMGSRLISLAIIEDESRFTSVVFGGRVPTWQWGESDEAVVQKRYQLMMNNPPQELIDQGADPIALANVQLGLEQLTVSIESLTDLDLPILSIMGGNDPRLASAQEFKKFVPTTELVILEGETHRSTPVDPKFLSAIKEFLARNKGK